MSGTTLQIFNQLQGSNGFISPTATLATTLGTEIGTTTANWSTSKMGVLNADILAIDAANGGYLTTKGLTKAIVDAGSDADHKAMLRNNAMKTQIAKSLSEFSQRMMLTDSYRSAQKRLGVADSGVTAYNNMYAIHGTTVKTLFNNTINQLKDAQTKLTALKTAIAAKPIVVNPGNPNANPPVPATVTADPTVDTAIANLKTSLETCATRIATFDSQGLTATNADINIVTTYTKYISDAYLATTLPQWYADPMKNSNISNVASTTLKNLLT